MLLGLEPEVEADYHRVLADFEPIGALGAPCLSVADVLRAHYLVANHFYLEGAGIGGIGPRSRELLESAVYRQVASFGGVVKWDRLFDVTATLFFGIIRNHAFYDANKRTAFLSALYQLYEGGFCPAVSEKTFEDFTVDIAERALGKYARYRDLARSGDPDPEVKFISKWLKDNTRRVDNKRYAITYRELEVILKRYGFHMEDPEDNYISIFKYETKRRMFGVLAPEIKRIRVGRIGFPRWTCQVLPQTVKLVRQLTSLSAKDGVDSGAFFHGMDPMQSLITTYNAPLLRLANR
jgi:prophage maintenance system killer protein